LGRKVEDLNVKSSSTTPALWVAGAAVGAAALWLGKRHIDQASANKRAVDDRNRFNSVAASHGEIVGDDGSAEGRESTELPVGRSADPDIDGSLSHRMLAIDETSGSSLFSEPEPPPEPSYREMPLDDLWNALPGMSEGEQTEGYDAVTPEELGSVWLERATQTTHEYRPHASDPNDVPELEALAVSESSLSAALSPDDEDDDEIRDDDLDTDPFPEHRSRR
jgi:hypothetical protein